MPTPAKKAPEPVLEQTPEELTWFEVVFEYVGERIEHYCQVLWDWILITPYDITFTICIIIPFAIYFRKYRLYYRQPFIKVRNIFLEEIVDLINIYFKTNLRKPRNAPAFINIMCDEEEELLGLLFMLKHIIGWYILYGSIILILPSLEEYWMKIPFDRAFIEIMLWELPRIAAWFFVSFTFKKCYERMKENHDERHFEFLDKKNSRIERDWAYLSIPVFFLFLIAALDDRNIFNLLFEMTEFHIITDKYWLIWLRYFLWDLHYWHPGAPKFKQTHRPKDPYKKKRRADWEHIRRRRQVRRFMAEVRLKWEQDAKDARFSDLKERSRRIRKMMEAEERAIQRQMPKKRRYF